MATSAHPAEKAQDVEAWNDNVEKAVDLFWDFLVKNLSVSHLLMYIHLDKVRRITRNLHHLESNEGKSEEAAAKLLAAIKESHEPGRWRMLINALKQTGGEDSIILHYLLESDSMDPWLDNQEHRRLIDLFREPLSRNLNLEALLPKMIQVGLISSYHSQKIKAKEDMGETAFARVELIAAMQSHKTDWYRKFITILYEDDHHRALAEMIDPDFCQEKLADKNEVVQPTQEQESQSPSGDLYPHDRQSTSANSTKGAGNTHSEPDHPKLTEENPQAPALSHELARQSTSHGAKAASDLHQSEVSCGCRCCAQLRMEVASLKSTVLDLRSELKEIKQLLMEIAQKDSN